MQQPQREHRQKGGREGGGGKNCELLLVSQVDELTYFLVQHVVIVMLVEHLACLSIKVWLEKTETVVAVELMMEWTRINNSITVSGRL